VVDLQAATEVFDLRSSEFTAETTLLEEQLSSVSSIGGHSYLTGRSEEDLPNKLAVLFVDDSAVLRKLFRRSIQKVAPDWDFREAAVSWILVTRFNTYPNLCSNESMIPHFNSFVERRSSYLSC
jgi:hypothetical protein